MIRITLFVLLIATTAPAQTLGTVIFCAGSDPDWTLEATETGATFTFQRASDMTEMLVTIAEGADWPRALTYVGRGDSAILMLENTACASDTTTGPLTARVLTQRGQTPILLTGCCLPLQG